VGLRNYVQTFGNPLFLGALRNTFYFVLVGGPLSVLASLLSALLLSSKLVRARALFRTVYFAPQVTALVAVAIVWRYMYHPRYGLLNHALGLFHLGPIDWLGNPHWAMPAIILLAVWKNFGYNMLIFVAGLQSIPEELYEAAAVDGASPWHRFVNVTLPGLGPTFLFVGITTMIGQFQLFSEPYVMTQGGPLRATTSLVLLMYEEGFRWWRMGIAATIAFILFAITLAGTLLQMRLQARRR
jgi:multiple sugar transport system permease protein